MARLTLPANYLATLDPAVTTRQPRCKVEIEYGGSYHDVSADVVSVSITQTMDKQADSAMVMLANTPRYYSRLWGGEANPRAAAKNRIRIYMTNAPADWIQVFQGYIIEGDNAVKRGDEEATQLQCVDNGRPAWLSQITMDAVLGRGAPSGGVYRVRRNAAQRQINALVTAILEDAQIGFAAGDISLAALDYSVMEWKPSTFNAMADIAELLGVKHHFLRFRYDGKAVSGPIIPTGASTWTYGALGSYPLHVSLQEQWREPDKLASIVNVTGHQFAAVPELNPDAVKIWEGDLWKENANPALGPLCVAEWKWNDSDWVNQFRVDAVTPAWSQYGNLAVRLISGHLEDVNTVTIAPAEPPYEDTVLIDLYWQGTIYADDYAHVEVWGNQRNVTEGDYHGTATNTELAAAGYSRVIDEQNDYCSDDAACAWLAQRLATWLQNECYPATLVVPCNLVHEPGDLITVGLDNAAGALVSVNYIIRSHRMDYERGKPNLSTLELVRDTTHMWT